LVTEGSAACPNFVPHFAQNTAPARFSNWHFGQFMLLFISIAAGDLCAKKYQF
jgi:hypothetical protein